MIDRIVLFKLNDEHANAAARAEIAAYSKAALAAIPGAIDVRVGLPADEASTKSWDLSIVVRFENLEAVKTYLTHPDHTAYVREYMRPRMVVVKYWNFEAI
ncbi:MAG: Dabb family protein [Myxococcota bacterium]